MCPGTLLRPIRYKRIGEASHPGPVIKMPGDGHCLYHALGWWAGLSQGQVRQEVANISKRRWFELCPWDDGQEYKHFQRQTVDRTEWGGAMQVAAMAKIRGVKISIKGEFRTQTFGSGEHWQIIFSGGRAAHYDVLYQPDDTEDNGDREKEGGAKPTTGNTNQKKAVEHETGSPKGSEGRTPKKPQGKTGIGSAAKKSTR